MERWYVLDPSATRPTGPFTLEEMRAMAAGGGLHRGSQVARAGAAGWTAAESDLLLAPLLGVHHTPPTSPQPLPVAAGEPYSFGNAWRLGERTIQARYRTMLVAGLVVFAINLPVIIPSILTNPLIVGSERAASPGMALGLGCVSWIYNLLVLLPIVFGAVLAGAEASEGRGSPSDLFGGFRRYGVMLAATAVLFAICVAVAVVSYIPIVIGIAVGVASGAGGQAGMAGPAVGVGLLLTLLLLLVLCIGFLTRVWFAPVIAIDPSMGRMGVADAFRLSWAATRGRAISMFAFLMVSIILSGLTIFLCGVGYLLLGLPLLYAMTGSMYQLAIRNAPRAAA